ncbi:hypothetical protein [Mycobacterium sp. CnD-18-1]|uniref:hypothetical protein n=1 Tax=Mycobacterium sp. CnD-18-1 TaxID=2917744 RepID=UPI001EF2BFE6|nr:hypothetical protein [Mycobacterium sp. CnD-18-1]MCG7607077.1 hypothetical protein [Mycobacterium sp. CnD-18-1]
MPRAFDRLTPQADFDPTNVLEFDPIKALKMSGELWQTILNGIAEFAENLVKEFIQRLVGLVTDPEQALSELWDALTGWTANVPGLAQLVEALTGVAGGLTELASWAENLWQQIVSAINDNAGINLASWDDFVASLSDGKGIDLPFIGTAISGLSDIFGGINFADLDTPEEIWQSVVETFIEPIINIVEQIGDGLSTILGPIFGGLDFNDLPSPSAVWQHVISTLLLPLNLLLGPNSPLNLANAFGKLLPFNISGLGLSQLTTAVENLLEGFLTEFSVPNDDGWSWDDTIGSPGSAKVVADGTTKTLYAPDVIQVDSSTKLNPLEIKVAYDSVVSGAGQTIKFVLETFTDTLGQVSAGSEVVDGITNPSGSGSATLSFPDWTPPTGVLSILPTLVVTDAVAAGSVNFYEPVLEKPLDSVLAGGLPAALNNLGDWIESLVDQLLGALGLPALGTLFDKIMDLGDEIEGWFGDTLNTASDLASLIGDLLSNPASVLGSLPQSLISGLETALESAGGAIADAIVQALGGSGTGHDAADVLAALANIPQSVITGLTGSLGDINTTLNQIGDIFDGAVVTPVNSIVNAIKSWFTSWFGGGSSQAIPVSQKGVASGVAPLNSSTKLATSYLETNVANGVPKLDGSGWVPTAHIPPLNSEYIPVGAKGAANGVAPLNSNAVVPLANLPEEVGGSGGTGSGRPWVVLYSNSPGPITTGTVTDLTGWSQTGSAAVTFEDSTNTRWKFGAAGIWQVAGQMAFASGGTGIRELQLIREAFLGSTAVNMSQFGAQAPASSARAAYANISGMLRVVDFSFVYTYTPDDWFTARVWHNQGANLNMVTGNPFTSGGAIVTHLFFTYMGAA